MRSDRNAPYEKLRCNLHGETRFLLSNRNKVAEIQNPKQVSPFLQHDRRVAGVEVEASRSTEEPKRSFIADKIFFGLIVDEPCEESAAGNL